MADFCMQCSESHGFPNVDLVGITTAAEWDEGKAAVVICEGCGHIQVDPQGRCISNCLEKHGEPDEHNHIS